MGGAVMGGQKITSGTLVGVVVIAVALVGLVGFAGWKRFERTRADEREERLRSCAKPECAKPAECAMACARQYLERNGWVDPAMAKLDEAVFELMNHAVPRDMTDVLRSRARTYRPDPSVVCSEPFGFRVVFPFPGNENPLWGGVVIMTRDYRNLRVANEQELFKALPPDCAFTKWANP